MKPWDKDSFLCGENFRQLCDVTYADNNPRDGETRNPLPDRGVVFCKSDYLLEFVTEAEGKPGPLTLVTHNSDFSINDDHGNAMPQSVASWFGTNMLTNDPRCHAIPIGLANPWYEIGDTDVITDKALGGLKKRLGVFIAIDFKTNPIERTQALEFAFGSFPPVDRWIVPDKAMPVPFEEYVEAVASTMFTLAPMGNGQDTHRLWECLYLRSIPITRLENSKLTNLIHRHILNVGSWDKDFSMIPRNGLSLAQDPTNIPWMWMPYWDRVISRSHRRAMRKSNEPAVV